MLVGSCRFGNALGDPIENVLLCFAKALWLFRLPVPRFTAVTQSHTETELSCHNLATVLRRLRASLKGRRVSPIYDTSAAAEEEIIHLRKNVVINFDITVFHCVIKNKHLPSLVRFILL